MNYAEQKEHIKSEIRIQWISIVVLLSLTIITIFLMVWTWNMGGRVFIIFWFGLLLIFLGPVRPIYRDIKNKNRVLRRIEECEKWEDST